MNRKGLWSVILILSPQLGIWLDQCLLVDGILYLHLQLSIYRNAWLQNDLSEQAIEREAGIILISGLQDNTHNMLAQTKRQAQTNGVTKLCPL